MNRFARCVTALLVGVLLSVAARAQTPPAPKKELPGSKLPVSVYYSLPAEHARVLESFLSEYREGHAYLDLQSKNFPNPDELYRALNSPAQAPTIALMETSWLPHINKHGQLLPVETWMNKEQFLFNWSVKCNCYNPLWEASHVDGTLMALPYFFTTKALIYNADMLTTAGVKFPPATWEQLAAAALKMTVPGGTIGFALTPVSSNPRQLARSLQVLAWQTGSDLLTPQGALTGMAERAVTFISDLSKQQAVADPDRQVPPEQVGMFIGSVEDYLALRARGLNVKTAVVPGPDKNSRTTEMQAWTLGIFKSVPENQLYKVQELAFFLLDFPQQRRWAETTPYLAAHVKVFDNPFYRRERLADHAGLRVFLNSLSKSKPVDTASPSIQNMETMGRKVPSVLRGEKAARDLMTGLSAHP